MNVIWSAQALKSLKNIHDYISLDSPFAADHVVDEIVELGNSLGSFPEKYPKEQRAEKLNKNIRFVPKWDYKVVYEIRTKDIRIIDVFHCKQHPDRLRLG